jgi:hypothetical protein
MISTSSFSVSEVSDFLTSIGRPTAGSHFRNDMLSDRASHLMVSDWFQRYFPSNENRYLFRLMETHCVQFSPDL